MNFRRTLFIALAALVAVSAFAQLSPEVRDWPKSAVSYLLTEEEQNRWKNVKTDADARAFAELFWARRDPTPGTPVNEFRAEFESRVEFADRQFGEGRKKGSLTDRGKLYIMLGPPTKPIQRSGAQSGMAATPGSTGEGARQIWIYEQSKTSLPLGTAEAQFSFSDQFGTNQWVYDRGGRVDANGLYRAAAQASITQPNLTVAPGAQPAPTQTVQLPPPAAPAAPASDAGAIRTESLRTAMTEFKAAKTNPFKAATVTYAELLSPTGEYFVPVQLYIPKSAGLTADSVTTFFGVIEDATGKTVAEFEEPAKLASSNADLYFDRSLKLAPGTYRATLGLAADGKPVVMASSPMELKALSKDAAGLSRLLVSGDVHETAEAAVIGAPFAFGRVKIVPKGDRTFTNKDEITYFVEVVNPAIDEATNSPKLQVKLDLVQGGTGGTPARTISAPIADAAALPLSGQPGPGQYAILAGIPLGQMKNPLPAGDYTLRVKVFDQVKKENWTVEEKLKLVNAPAATAGQ
jgi:GWxTD domain-containing protein